MPDSSLVTLLVKLGVVASLASILVRWSAVKRMLMRENRTLAQRVKLSLWFSGVFGASVAVRGWCRHQAGTYQAVDLGLEGSLLAGMLGGYVTGLIVGNSDLDSGHDSPRIPDHAAAGGAGRVGRPVARLRDRIRRISGVSARSST